MGNCTFFILHFVMTVSLLITFRETLEMTLIVGIVLAYLRKTEAPYLFHRSVWAGVFAAIIASTILAALFDRFLGGFGGRQEEIVDGILTLVAAVLLTWMIHWMRRQAHIRQNLERKVEAHQTEQALFGLFLLVFASVLREGIETVIFLNAAASTGHSDLFGAMFGIILALLLGFLFFAGAHKMHLRWFFRMTSSLLILFAAGLVAYGIHELQEAHLLPFFTTEAWNMNHILNEEGSLGSILRGLLGYNGNPSILEALAYGIFLMAMVILFLVPSRKLSLHASTSLPS